MKLGLGTVQFGLNYGISNPNGKTDSSEVKRILASAEKTGVRVLDTAALYGSSEQVLGDCLDPGHSFRIVTKTEKGEDPEVLEKTFLSSLRHLKVDKTYGLLVHRAEDLMSPGAKALVDRLRALKERGLAEKIGVSIYSAEQVESIFGRFDLDLVQLPLSLLDQRLIRGGHLKSLKAKGVEIHARSAFLQGLLLMDPGTLSPFFAPLKSHLEKYRAFLRERGISPLAAAFGFVAGRPEVDSVICGVNSLPQFEELAALGPFPIKTGELDQFALEDPFFLNPSNWKV